MTFQSVYFDFLTKFRYNIKEIFVALPFWSYELDGKTSLFSTVLFLVVVSDLVELTIQVNGLDLSIPLHFTQ